QHDVLTEHDVAPARSQQLWIERLAQRKAQRARHGLRKLDNQFVFEERAPSGAADDELGVLLARRLRRIAQLFLCLRDYSHPASRYQSSVCRMPSSSPTFGSYPSSSRARVMSNARLFVKKSTRRR